MKIFKSLMALAAIVFLSSFTELKNNEPILSFLRRENLIIYSSISDYKADLQSNPGLKNYEKMVIIAYRNVEIEYEVFKDFVIENLYFRAGVPQTLRKVAKEKTHKANLQKALQALHSILLEAKLKNEENKQVNLNGGLEKNKKLAENGIEKAFDPTGIAVGLMDGGFKLLQSAAIKRWEERKELIKELKDPRFKLVPYNDIRAFYN